MREQWCPGRFFPSPAKNGLGTRLLSSMPEKCIAWLTTVALLCVRVSGPSAGGIFSQEPGFRVMLTKKGVDYVFGPVLREELGRLSLPDINDEKSVAVVGKVEYWITQIVVQEVTIPSTAMEGGEDELTISISDMLLSMNAKWKYKQKGWPKLKDKGTVDIKAKDVSLSQTVSVKNDGSGKIAVSSVRCSFDVRKISVKFHGGASWLYNLFTSFIETRIKDQLKSQVCKMVTEAVNTFGNEVASTLPLSVEVSDGMEVSCALLGNPVISSSYLLTNHNGEFISAQHPQEAPLSPLPLPSPSSLDPSSKMVYIWLTSYPLDTAAYVYKEAAYMEYDLTHDEIPYFLPRTTTDFKLIIPQLYQQFPNVDVSYGIRATLPPTLLLSSGQAALLGETEMTVSVVESSEPRVAFSLTVSVQCDVDIGIQHRQSGLFVIGEVTSFTTEIVSTNTNIGEYNFAPFQELLDTMTKFLVVPNINRILHTGQPLPSIGSLTAINTAVSIAEGYILVETDFSFYCLRLAHAHSHM